MGKRGFIYKYLSWVDDPSILLITSAIFFILFFGGISILPNKDKCSMNEEKRNMNIKGNLIVNIERRK